MCVVLSECLSGDREFRTTNATILPAIIRVLLRFSTPVVSNFFRVTERNCNHSSEHERGFYHLDLGVDGIVDTEERVGIEDGPDDDLAGVSVYPSNGVLRV
ncbi:MAG: hypothetical protein J07HX5_00075 [halophilic archaeon J07HX5]|jgi:hypothetical protein|nr:MAG: hypothetical protein J07HX5_00075 [halophilic archaeon J07HX5]